MRIRPALFALALTGFLGCEALEEKEMKGILTVNKAQYGNEFLEVKDPESGLTRFIHPGKKIISITKSWNYQLTIMDSRRVQLAKISLPDAEFDSKASSLKAKGYTINQAWGVIAKRTPHTVREEYIVKNSNGYDCKISNCKSPEDCRGTTGSVWHVVDSRYDYWVYFMNEATGKPIGTFYAVGEVKTSSASEHIEDCRPLIRLTPLEEAFE